MSRRIQAAADAIDSVYRGSQPIAPLRQLFDTPDVETAYAIQEVNTRRWLEAGRRLAGRKIGLTSKSVQAQLGVDQPDYGMLFDDMRVANGSQIAFSAVCQARIEGEIAFTLARDVDDPGIDMAGLEHAIDYASSAFEIVGSRIRDWNIQLFDTIADNASSGLYVLGDARIPLNGIDLASCRMTLTQDGKPVSEGSGAACLGNPLNAALWLSHKMIESGRPLEAGDVIMSGALGPFVEVEQGASYSLEIENFDDVTVSFT